jgi:hypothetical protein
MNMPPRVVTVLCSVQVFCIVVGFLVTKASLRIYERWWDLLALSDRPQIGGFCQFVRSFGPWCLMVPLVWGVWVTARVPSEPGGASITRSQLIISVALTVAVALVFLLSVWHSIELACGSVVR